MISRIFTFLFHNLSQCLFHNCRAKNLLQPRFSKKHIFQKTPNMPHFAIKVNHFFCTNSINKKQNSGDFVFNQIFTSVCFYIAYNCNWYTTAFSFKLTEKVLLHRFSKLSKTWRKAAKIYI